MPPGEIREPFRNAASAPRHAPRWKGMPAVICCRDDGLKMFRPSRNASKEESHEKQEGNTRLTSAGRRRQWSRRPPRAARARHAARGRGRDRRRQFAHRRRCRAAARRSLEHGARSADPALWRAGEIRKQGRPHADQSQERAAHQPGAHAASSARRHDHAERPAFRGGPHRLPRHRPGQAPPGDPWPRQAAAGVRPRGACALSDGDAHQLRRMRRQQRAALQQGPGAGQRAGDPRPPLLLRMDGRAALDAARRDRHRPEGEVAPRGRRGRAEHEPQHPDRQGAR